MSELNIYMKLQQIQTKLKAPKGQYNSFGKYYYRNCEDILEALKPLLAEFNCTLLINDSVEHIGERYYVKAHVIFIDNESKEMIRTEALAREEENKKGMDGSQVTGASSSYARKYALNGLFAIDDNKDSDSTNDGKKEDKPKQEPTTKQESTSKVGVLSDKQIQRAYAIAKGNNLTEDAIKKWIKGKYNKDSLKDLTKVEYDALCEALEKAKEAS